MACFINNYTINISLFYCNSLSYISTWFSGRKELIAQTPPSYILVTIKALFNSIHIIKYEKVRKWRVSLTDLQQHVWVKPLLGVPPINKHDSVVYRVWINKALSFFGILYSIIHLLTQWKTPFHALGLNKKLKVFIIVTVELKWR